MNLYKLSLPFKLHEVFKKADILDRQELYQSICELIWGAITFVFEY